LKTLLAASKIDFSLNPFLAFTQLRECPTFWDFFVLTPRCRESIVLAGAA
jgi:hypothetical protein